MQIFDAASFWSFPVKKISCGILCGERRRIPQDIFLLLFMGQERAILRVPLEYDSFFSKRMKNQKRLFTAAIFIDSRIACIEVSGIQTFLDQAQGFAETGRLK